MCGDALFPSIRFFQIVEKHLLPLIQRLFSEQPVSQLSRLCSRRFIRQLLLSTRLPTFLSTVPHLLAMGALSPPPSDSQASPDPECAPQNSLIAPELKQFIAAFSRGQNGTT